MAHRNLENRVEIRTSGAFYIGVGDQFDDDRRRIRVGQNLSLEDALGERGRYSVTVPSTAQKHVQR
jgi:hypothetical protein